MVAHGREEAGRPGRRHPVPEKRRSSPGKRVRIGSCHVAPLRAAANTSSVAPTTNAGSSR